MSPMAERSLVGAWTSNIAPPPDLTVSQWADAHRILPESSAARGARWVTDSVSYTRGVMDAACTPGVRAIVLEKAAQTSGTECIQNIIGYNIQHEPCAMLFVQPTSDQAQSYSKDRLDDLIRSTPALRRAVQTKRGGQGGQAESTLDLKMFPGGYLALGGANSPNTFARWSVRVAIADDFDRFPAVVGDEGDPAALLANRTRTFVDSLLIFVSTPTLKGGRIDSLYGRTDQRRFCVACLDCGHEDWITWSDDKHFFITFDNRDPETARVQCPSCSAQLREADRREMIARAGAPDNEPYFGWRPTAKSADLGWVGFHLPAMISTLGKVTLPELVENFLSARALGRESLKAFVNTTLAEGWEDRGAKKDPHPLHRRRESYGDGVEVPAQASAITAGVDVQDGYFQILVTAWSPGTERWVIDWRRVPGDPKRPETRAALLEALNRRYRHASGVDLPIHAVCIDTGYATEEMYDFVLAHQVRRIYATKGVGGKQGEPLMMKAAERKYGKSARPVTLYLINVDDAKSDIYSDLDLVEAGPGYIHFPLNVDAVDEEFFAQLCGEHKETRYNKWKVATHSVWVQDRERNEALDCSVLCLIAFKQLNPNLAQMAAAIQEHAGRGNQQATPGQQQTPPGRRVGRSNYMENS